MTEERRIQLVAEVDATRTRDGFNEIAQQAGTMAASVNRAGEQAERSVSGIGSGAGRSAREVESAQRNLIGSIQRTTAAMEAGSRTSASYYEVLARQRGVDPAVLAPYLTRLREVEAAQIAANNALGGAAPALGRVGASANATAAVLRGVPAQITDIITSLQGGQRPLTVFIQQGGQLRDMFANAGVPLRALGGYLLGLVNPFTVAAAAVGILAYAYHEGSKETDAYSKSLILSGNVAGTTAGQMADMARNISKSVGTQSDAADVLAQLAGTGNVSAANLQRFAAVAIQSQKSLGIGASDMAKNFAELGGAPLQASEKLNQQYHYLTASTYAQIKALTDLGKTEEAAAIAQNAFADSFGDKSKAMEVRLGYIERGWLSVKEAVLGAGSALKNVGRADTEDDKVQQAQKALVVLKNRLKSVGPSGRTGEVIQEEIDKQQKILDTAKALGDAKARIAAYDAATIKHNEADIAWQKEGLQYLDRKTQLQKELDRNQSLGIEAGMSDEAINTRALAIRKKYSDIFNDGIDSQIEAIKRRGEIEDAVAKRSLDLLTANRAAGLISEEEYTAGVAQFELAAFVKRKQQLQEELTLTAGKQNSQKDQAALRGEIAKQDALATSRQLQLTNDLNTQRSKGEQEIAKQIQASVNQRGTLNAALEVEYQLYGKSSDARELAMVSIKSEAELQKKISDAIAARKPLTDEHIAQLRAEKNALDDVTKSTIAQTKALGYAQQLADENKRFAAESIFDERERAAAILQIDAEVWQKRIDLAGEGTEAKKKLQEQYVTWYANQANKPMIDQWRESVKKYDDIFRKGFADMVNNGKSGWASFTKSLTTTFKTSVADQIYKMFAQPFVMKLVASLIGVTGSAAATAAGSVAGAAGTGIGIAGTIGSIGSGAFQTAGALLAGDIGFGSTLSAGFSAIATGTASGLTAGFASVVGALGPIALGIGAAVSIWKSMDTSGTYHTGGASSASTAGVTTIRAEDLHFEATRISADTEALTGKLAAGIVSILDSTASAFGKTAGYTAATAFADDTSKDGAWGGLVIEKLGAKILDWQDTKTGSWAPKTFSDGDAGKAEYLAALSGSVRTVLDGIGLPSWAGSMLDALGAAPTIEQLTATVNTIVATQNALATLGDRLVGFAGMSAAAASALMAASGGIDKLAANASVYYDKFYNDGEKAAAVTKQMTAALASVGLALPKTDADFRALVETQMGLGEAGAKAVAVLLSNAGAFADLTAATSKATEATKAQTDASAEAAAVLAQRADLQKQLDELTMTSAQIRERDRAAISETNLALYDQVQALKASKAATEAQATAVASAMASLKTLTDAAMSDVTKSAAAEKTRLGVIRDVAAESVRSITGVFDLLRDQVASLYGTVSSTSAMQAAQGNSFIDQALATVQSTGYLPDQQQLVSAIAAARGGLDANQFATQFEADRAALVMAGKLSQIQAITGDQLSAADKALKVANDQLSALDAQLAFAQQQVDALNGINTGVLSMSAAMNGLAAAIKAQATAAAVATSSGGGASAVAAPASIGMSVSDLYQQVLGRSPDKSGLDFWTAAYGSSVSQSEMADFMAAAAPELSAKASGTWNDFLRQHNVPGYATGGDFAGGLRLVGENGPELEVTGPSRIYSNSQLQGMMSGGGNTERLERLVEALTTEVQRLRSDVADGNRNMAQLADQFDNATEGGNGLRTVTIEDRT